jgi:hypothetical protein
LVKHDLHVALSKADSAFSSLQDVQKPVRTDFASCTLSTGASSNSPLLSGMSRQGILLADEPDQQSSSAAAARH